MLTFGGRVRVAEGKQERAEQGWQAGVENFMEREEQVPPAENGTISISMSEAVQLYKDLTGNLRGPKLPPEIFGLVDASDRADSQAKTPRGFRGKGEQGMSRKGSRFFKRGAQLLARRCAGYKGEGAQGTGAKVRRVAV